MSPSLFDAALLAHAIIIKLTKRRNGEIEGFEMERLGRRDLQGEFEEIILCLT
jgi:hypothetical protein